MILPPPPGTHTQDTSIIDMGRKSKPKLNDIRNNLGKDRWSVCSFYIANSTLHEEADRRYRISHTHCAPVDELDHPWENILAEAENIPAEAANILVAEAENILVAEAENILVAEAVVEAGSIVAAEEVENRLGRSKQLVAAAVDNFERELVDKPVGDFVDCTRIVAKKKKT